MAEAVGYQSVAGCHMSGHPAFHEGLWCRAGIRWVAEGIRESCLAIL